MPNSTINIRYFAMLRDLAGRDQEELAIEPGATAAQVYVQLAERYGFTLRLDDIRVAVNDDFASPDHPLAAGDAVVFIPPVAGG